MRTRSTRSGLEERRRDEGDAARRRPEAAILALQRSAGNQAVARVLQRRSLQRLQEMDVPREEKKEYERVKKLYADSFNDGKPFAAYETKGTWVALRNAAQNVAELVQTIDTLVAQAKAAMPQAAKTAAPEPKAPQKRSGRGTKTIQVGTLDEYVLNEGKDPADVAKPVDSLPPHLANVQRALDNWGVDGHAGMGQETVRLDRDDVILVYRYITAKWAATPFKGLGSGRHAGVYQLKVSDTRKHPVSQKQLTWHMDLSQDTYANLPPYIRER
ncbi:hypothetical protein [Solirubrobacter soli]|uniref:hypothetical protein n=1 Tax=Solirubrobacter soli TaxID=363832 RepID=UPI000404CA43|nr:hypothetical protein [Solirubrobacter soli]